MLKVGPFVLTESTHAGICSSAQAEAPSVAPRADFAHQRQMAISFVHSVPEQRRVRTTHSRRPRGAPGNRQDRQKSKSRPQLVVNARPQRARLVIVPPGEIVDGAEAGKGRAIEQHRVGQVTHKDFDLAAYR